MKNNDFQPPNSKLSFLSISGGFVSAILLIVGLELWAKQLNQTAKTEPTVYELVLKAFPLNLSQP